MRLDSGVFFRQGFKGIYKSVEKGAIFQDDLFGDRYGLGLAISDPVLAI